VTEHKVGNIASLTDVVNIRGYVRSVPKACDQTESAVLDDHVKVLALR
jgi:hypothetical protein